MKILKFISIILIFQQISQINCEKKEELKSDAENFIEESSKKNQNKDGPVKIEIIGDTSHLFADEDFEKKESIPLGVRINLGDSIQLVDEDSEKYNTNDKENQFSEKQTLEDITSTEILREAVKNITEHQNHNSENKSIKCIHSSKNLNLSLTNLVQIVNGSALTKHLTETKDNECFLVLFYVPWCPFSVRLAPLYNAVPRAFSNFDVLAFDVSRSVGYNTKFGTSAVPMIILFQHKNVLAKLNYTNKSLIDYIEFVTNHTGLISNRSIVIESQDFEGPVPTKVVKYFDYYLLISWVFVIFVACDLIIRKTQLTPFLIQIVRRVFNFDRLRQLQNVPQQHMIRNANDEHLHND